MKEKAESGKAVFFSTHVMEVAEKLCDRLAIINGGKIMFEGSLQNLREKRGENSSLEKLFLELVDTGNASVFSSESQGNENPDKLNPSDGHN